MTNQLRHRFGLNDRQATFCFKLQVDPERNRIRAYRA
jgi:hypothetical protein